MGLLVSIALGLSLWVFLWGLGAKAIDAIMITLLIVIVACAWRIFSPYLPGKRPEHE